MFYKWQISVFMVKNTGICHEIDKKIFLFECH